MRPKSEESVPPETAHNFDPSADEATDTHQLLGGVMDSVHAWAKAESAGVNTEQPNAAASRILIAFIRPPSGN